MLGTLLGLPVMGIQMPGFGTGLLTIGLVLCLTLALRGTGQALVMVLWGIAIRALAGVGRSLVKLLTDPEQHLPGPAQSGKGDGDVPQAPDDPGRGKACWQQSDAPCRRPVITGASDLFFPSQSIVAAATSGLPALR